MERQQAYEWYNSFGEAAGVGVEVPVLGIVLERQACEKQ